MKRYKYNINNLDCYDCAKRIEDTLNKDERFKNVVVNFNTSKIIYESDIDISLEDINKIVRGVEPESFVSTSEDTYNREYHLYILIIGLIIGLVSNYFIDNNILKLVLFIISYIILLYKTFINAIKMIVNSKIINENFLITVSCIGAFIIGERFEGLMVISLYIIGKILEERALNNSRKSISNLTMLKQDYANKVIDGKIEKVLVDDVLVGDTLVIRKGEKVPVDGVITSGEGILDTSSLTGESELVKVGESSEVLSGYVNTFDAFYMKATSVYKDSTVSRILSLIEDASSKKSKSETLVSKISKVYTPTVILLSIFVIIFLPFIFDISFKESLYRGLTFLVISCPCAIAISVPLAYFTSIGVSSRNGILVKGSNFLDNLSNIKNIIFDKTGTLTTGSVSLDNIEIFDDKYSYDDIVSIIRKGESLSSHPIANSIMKISDMVIDNSDVTCFKEIDGKGISYKIGDDRISIGNKKMCNCDNDSVLHLNINSKHVASIYINDSIREEAFNSIKSLKDMNVNVYMFTGDKKKVALDIGNKLGIDNIKYEMLPQDKYACFEDVAKTGITAFVGDGVNDALVLKRADIGISMGNIGSDIAINSSDIILISDDISKINTCIYISLYTKKIIKENLIFALATKIIVLILSAFGYVNMWACVFADTGVTLLTIINTLRIIKKFKISK